MVCFVSAVASFWIGIAIGIGLDFATRKIESDKCMIELGEIKQREAEFVSGCIREENEVKTCECVFSSAEECQ
jgi:hypothetical protein